MAEWTIDGVRHGGITVSDLDRSLEFYCGLLGFELLWRRLYEEPQITQIVAVPEATGIEIAMVRVPGGEIDVELLEYQGVDRGPATTDPAQPGTGHFCVFVTNIDALHAELAGRGVAFRSDGPVEMTGGPNAGGKSLYSLDPDGYIFEFHQRPPR